MGQSHIITFDGDSKIAVQVDGKPVAPEHYGARLGDVKVMSINGTAVDSWKRPQVFANSLAAS
jgi:hypothetical protein